MKALKAKFFGSEILVINHNDKPYVPMKQVAENIGLDWKAQHRRLSNNEVLNSTMVIMTTIAEDGKNREMVCLPLHYLNGWLFGVDTKRVKSSIREKLTQYKKECYEVLWQYWENGVVKREQVKARLAEIDEWDKETFSQAQSGSQLMLKRKKSVKRNSY